MCHDIIVYLLVSKIQYPSMTNVKCKPIIGICTCTPHLKKKSFESCLLELRNRATEDMVRREGHI